MTHDQVLAREMAERPAGYQGPNLSPVGLKLGASRLFDGSYALMANIPPKDNNGVITGTHRRLLSAAGGRVLGRTGGHPAADPHHHRAARWKAVQHAGHRHRRRYDYLVVASNGGAATQPGWVRNIAAHPAVTIRRGGFSQHRQAWFLTPAEQADWWPRLVAAYPPYATMQAKTDRQLPVLRLSPAGSTPAPAATTVTPTARSSPPADDRHRRQPGPPGGLT